MPRRPRLAAGALAYHVLNRRVGRLPLFEKPADCTAFEQILAEAVAATRLRAENKRGRESFLDEEESFPVEDGACRVVHVLLQERSPTMC